MYYRVVMFMFMFMIQTADRGKMERVRVEGTRAEQRMCRNEEITCRRDDSVDCYFFVFRINCIHKVSFDVLVKRKSCSHCDNLKLI